MERMAPLRTLLSAGWCSLRGDRRASDVICQEPRSKSPRMLSKKDRED